MIVTIVSRGSRFSADASLDCPCKSSDNESAGCTLELPATGCSKSDHHLNSNCVLEQRWFAGGLRLMDIDGHWVWIFHDENHWTPLKTIERTFTDSIIFQHLQGLRHLVEQHQVASRPKYACPDSTRRRICSESKQFKGLQTNWPKHERSDAPPVAGLPSLIVKRRTTLSQNLTNDMMLYVCIILSVHALYGK